MATYPRNGFYNRLLANGYSHRLSSRQHELQMLSTLPSSSFVAFETKRLAKPELLWTRKPAIAEQYLRRFAFCCPLAGEPDAAYLNESRSMLAERYGGKGIGVNGGGVRCGWFEGRQIKGVGRTALAGINAPYWHSYGGASANEAIREAIWGEVFNAALPYGAITVDSIIVTGTTVELRYPDHIGVRRTRRALIVRPGFLRPAHFMRSVLFRPESGFHDSHASDVDRTRAAVRTLRKGLALAVGGFEGDPLPDLLAPAFRRYATQIAAARAKRLLHGSISASNIALDGRFLDFGMSSSASDHGRVIVARGCPDAWQQHADLTRSIDDLAYYIDKYAGEGIGHLALRNYLRAIFLSTVAQRFDIELVKLSGLPEADVVGLPRAELAQVAAVFREVLETDSKEPFKLLCPCDEYVPEMPNRMGKYHLGTCIKRAVAGDSPESSDRALAAELTDPRLRQRFVAAVWVLRATQSNGRHGNSASKALDFMRFNAYRLSARLDALYSYILRPRIDVAVAAGEEAGAFISRSVNPVADLVRDPIQSEVRVCVPNSASVLASPTMGIRIGGSEVTLKTLRDRLPGVFGSDHELW